MTKIPLAIEFLEATSAALVSSRELFKITWLEEEQTFFIHVNSREQAAILIGSQGTTVGALRKLVSIMTKTSFINIRIQKD